MNQETSRVVTSCLHCHASFDVLEARWCDCVVRESSIVCPHCFNCFCKASAAYKLQFWQEAPASLLRERIRSLRKDDARIADGGAERTASDAPLVLVVDDSRTVRAIARLTLESAGYRVAEASDAIEGLRLIHADAPALVLSDALMPKMDGREMCRLIKGDPKTSGIRVVLMTALYTAARYRAEALRSFHADDYIAKPVSPSKLLEIIAGLLFRGAASQSSALLQAEAM